MFNVKDESTSTRNALCEKNRCCHAFIKIMNYLDKSIVNLLSKVGLLLTQL